MTLITRVSLQMTATLTEILDLSVPTDELVYSKRVDLASGTGAGQADMLWHDQRTLAASDTEDLDLASALSDAFGNTLVFATIKELLVVAAADNTNDVQVTRPAANGAPVFLAAGDGMPVGPGGMLHWIAPKTGVSVTAGTADLLTITNSGAGTAVTYDIVIIGTSA
jgi:hypothetical protein